MLKSKIHRAKVTDSDLDYEGSITIDRTLMDAANLVEFEKVDVYNITNGNRFSTYVLEGERDSGVICLNGAAAHMVSKGDLVIIACYALYSAEELKDHKPKLVFVDEKNRIKNNKKL